MGGSPSPTWSRWPLPNALRAKVDALTGCIAGAAAVDELRRLLADAGFDDVRVTHRPESRIFIREWLPGCRLEQSRRTAYAPVVPAPSPSGALAAESEHGVSFEEYVGVTTALAEGFPLETILAVEGIAADVWPGAEAMWTVRAAKDGAGGELLSELRTKRAVAEDCLVRGVAPIDSDLGAWLRFLHAYRNHAAPFDMLEGAGLGLNDLARLQRGWVRRMAADEALQKQAAELVKKGLGPLPPLRVEPKQLRPFPWTRRHTPDAMPEAPPKAVAAPADTSLAPGKIRLYSYVAFKAQLAEHPGDEQRVLDELGITDFAATDAGWQAVLASNAELERDYRRLLASQRARIRTAPRGGSVEPPPPHRAPSSKLAGTSLTVDSPRGSALPFVAGAPAPSMPEPRPPSRSFSGTSLALDAPSKPALPFGGAPSKLAGNSLVLDVARGPVLPFERDAATSVELVAAPPPPRPRPKLAETALAVDALRKAVLPFRGDVPPLEQHASLSCEIALAPERALETLARYRITPAQKVAADRHYAERFAREPGLRERWNDAYRTYSDFLANEVSR